MIKAVLFLIVSLLIFLKTDWPNIECNIRSANQAVAPIVWFEQTIDGSHQNPTVTRFYHNKVGVAGAQLSYCYFDRISPQFIFETSGIFGLTFLSYLVLRLAREQKWFFLLIFCSVALLPVLSINSPTSQASVSILAYIYKGLAIASLAKFLQR